MQIITVAVIKGGTGKTTTCAAIAQAARSEGQKVLAVDLDPQGSLTYSLGADRAAPGALDLLNGSEILDTIQQTAQGIDVISGAPELATYRTDNKTGTIYKLSDALEPVRGQYDLIIIDTPPYFCDLTYLALQAATGLLVAMQPDTGSLKGQEFIVQLSKKIKETNKRLKVLGAVITQYDKRPNINRYMREKIQEQGQRLKCPLLGEISKGVAILEAQALRRSLYEYAPRSKQAAEYKAIYNMIKK